MGEIWFQQFTSGLDARRLPETSAGGVLIRARDGHLNRGGEFENRPAFVHFASLPANTKGLAATRDGLVVFGSAADPVMPDGVSYQRLRHLDGGTALAAISGYTLFSGLIYASAKFADGSQWHYYDGVRIAGWFDGLSRTKVTISSGSANLAAAASGTIAISAVTGIGYVSSVTIGDVELLAANVYGVESYSAVTARRLRDGINANTAASGYSATVDGTTVTVTATTNSSEPNGYAIEVTATNITTETEELSGGNDGAATALTSLTVGGSDILGGSVAWADTTANFATAVAAQVNANSATSGFSAEASGSTVTIASTTPGTTVDGSEVAATVIGPLELADIDAMSGGADIGTDYYPGAYVRTVGTKVYTGVGSVMHFSGVATPSEWTTDTTGAGFIDLASWAEGADDLQAVAKYGEYLAVFAATQTQIWYVDPDPSNNKQFQVLDATGTESPKSVTQFGDTDIFYLHESGLRSLKARDSSSAATTTDIGVPIDPLVTEKLALLDDAARANIIGIVNPADGRFWLCMGDEIFVFTYFAGSKVSAWSSYTPAYFDEDGVQHAISVDDVVVFNRRLYVRSGDDLFVFGGASGATVYDATPAEAWLPYLDAAAPTAVKSWNGVDVAARGSWELWVAFDPENPNVSDKVGVVTGTTYNAARIPLYHSATHISLRARFVGEGAATLSAAVLHYSGVEPENAG